MIENNECLPFPELDNKNAKNGRKLIKISQLMLSFCKPISMALTILLLVTMNSFGQSSPFPNNGTGFFKLINWILAALAFVVGAYGMGQLLLAGYNYNKEGSMTKPLITAAWSLGAWTVAGGLIWNAVNNDSTPDIPDLDMGK